MYSNTYINMSNTTSYTNCGFASNPYTLFKIDETFKIINNFNESSIKYHELIYGNNIQYLPLQLHPQVLKYFENIIDEYGFFNNDVYDIDNICRVLNDLTLTYYNADKIMNITTKEPINNKIVKTQIPIPMEYKKNTESSEVVGIDTYNDSLNLCYINDMEININRREYYIIFNRFFLKSMIIKKKDFEKEIMDECFPELVLINCINLTNEEMNTVKEQIINIHYEKELKEKSLLFMNIYNKNKKWSDELPTFDTLKLYINSTYNINNNIENRIQFNDIYTKLLKDMKIKKEEYKSTVHKLLPLVLKDIGLDKKRYSQGVFWYGLEVKKIDLFDNYQRLVAVFNNNPHLENIKCSEYDDPAAALNFIGENPELRKQLQKEFDEKCYKIVKPTEEEFQKDFSQYICKRNFSISNKDKYFKFVQNNDCL